MHHLCPAIRSGRIVCSDSRLCGEEGAISAVTLEKLLLAVPTPSATVPREVLAHPVLCYVMAIYKI